MKRLILILIPLSIMLSSFSCQRNNQPEQKSMNEIKEEYKTPMMEWNQRKIRDQDLRIRGYIDRHNWDMTRTGTGLYYEVYQEGDGPRTDTGKIAIIRYDLDLLDGTDCYTSDSTGPKSLKMGRAEIETGLEEALFLMRVGDKARLIIPPHLGYGMPGDGDKIPSDATLVYHIELTDLED
ncbi:MAG: FKBP-type peptidyl-prolyl cis-trans isomerase [Bacteroidota bacterium]